MKLTVGRDVREGGFALPTILLVSTVMLIVLVASIAAAAASRVALDSQYYNELAQQAVESGMARATECLKNSGFTPQWLTEDAGRDLRPDTDCTGARVLGNSYVLGTAGASPGGVRTTYKVNAPAGSGIGSNLEVIGITELVRSSSPHAVWRRYEQVSYLRIEEPQTVACPDGFIAVPGNTQFGTNDFCVGKYEAKDVGGRAVSQADGVPIRSVNRAQAEALAEESCRGCHLITEDEWLTIAHNTLNVASNWSGGSPGNGYIYSGHNDNSPATPLAASSDDGDGYYGTGSASGNQRRTLTLSNGEVIWDLAGNVTEWTSGRASSGQPGLPSTAWREWNTIEGTGSLDPSPFPSYGTPEATNWTTAHGIGHVYSNSSINVEYSFLRGGGYDYVPRGWHAGIYTLYLMLHPNATAANIGFRIAYKPPIICSEGFIPVPGNSLFGTDDFCVSKYEAKNVGGTAVSQAAGVPWTTINQIDAATQASNACPRCRLINNAERLTIAHNVLNVASNWNTGVVGSGWLYRGHSDSDPFSGQAASASDSDGYINTGNPVGSNQRRTLTLSNGEVIWDFTGNVAEWSSGQVGVGKPGASGWAYRQWNSVEGSGSVIPSPFPSYGTPAAASWTTAHNLGALYSSTSDLSVRGFLWGGDFGNAANGGIFTLLLTDLPTSANPHIGFRMVEVE